jgi:hypothetical protein
VVDLSSSDRDQVNITLDEMGLAMANIESGPDVSPFSSKFDAVVAALISGSDRPRG